MGLAARVQGTGLSRSPDSLSLTRRLAASLTFPLITACYQEETMQHKIGKRGSGAWEQRNEVLQV